MLRLPRLEDLSLQIDYTASTEVSSTDLVGSRYAGVVDSAATIVKLAAPSDSIPMLGSIRPAKLSRSGSKTGAWN